MKLSEYAKQEGISYATALRWFHDGSIPGYQAPSGTIIVTIGKPIQSMQKVAVYARVSSSDNRGNLERQAQRLVQYCEAKGYQISMISKEIGSGLNESRPKLLALLNDPTIMTIVVEHKDRATHFGFCYIETLLHVQGRAIEVVNLAEDDLEDDQTDLMTDLASLVYSFCARLYGQRRAKHKTEKITAVLRDTEGKEEGDDAISGTDGN